MVKFPRKFKSNRTSAVLRALAGPRLPLIPRPPNLVSSSCFSRTFTYGADTQETWTIRRTLASLQICSQGGDGWKCDSFPEYSAPAGMTLGGWLLVPGWCARVSLGLSLPPGSAYEGRLPHFPIFTNASSAPAASLSTGPAYSSFTSQLKSYISRELFFSDHKSCLLPTCNIPVGCSEKRDWGGGTFRNNI